MFARAKSHLLQRKIDAFFQFKTNRRAQNSMKLATTEEKNTLRQFFKPDQPLGDALSIVHADNDCRLIHSKYIDTNNLLYRGLKSNPTMIVGRRGSGKTDILLSYMFGETAQQSAQFFPKVYFESPQVGSAISTVVTQIEDMLQSAYPLPAVEEVAEVWSNLFWTNVLLGIAANPYDQTSTEVGLIKKFCLALELNSDFENRPLETFLRTLLATKKAFVASGMSQGGISFFASFELQRYAGLTFREAKMAARNWLNANKRVALVLFDSIENLQINLTSTRLVMSGLIKCIGELRTTGWPIDIKCCVPAESYFRLMEISSNVLKDFRNTIILHWHVSELLRICMARYFTYLMLWDEGEYQKLVELYPDFSRENVRMFWTKVLPEKVHNKYLNTEERTIPYIVRHTQLLPRQLITLFNSILHRSAITTEKNPLPFEDNSKRIDSRIISAAVSYGEEEAAQGILNAHLEIWPDADNILRSVFSRLPCNIVSFGQMHRCFVESGVRKTYSIELNFHDFVRMASEVGAVGRMVETSREYVTAIFEYSQPSRLIFDPNDQICIHPIFTERYGIVKEGKIPAGYLPIYPRGTDPDSRDFRMDYWLE
jgi:hypothetical protein